MSDALELTADERDVIELLRLSHWRAFDIEILACRRAIHFARATDHWRKHRDRRAARERSIAAADLLDEAARVWSERDDSGLRLWSAMDS